MTACTHRKVTTYVFVDGNDPAGMWACAECGHRFSPVNLIMEKDAARYRWLRDGNNDTEGLCPFVAGDDLDRAIDAAIAGGPAVGDA